MSIQLPNVALMIYRRMSIWLGMHICPPMPSACWDHNPRQRCCTAPRFGSSIAPGTASPGPSCRFQTVGMPQGCVLVHARAGGRPLLAPAMTGSRRPSADGCTNLASGYSWHANANPLRVPKTAAQSLIVHCPRQSTASGLQRWIVPPARLGHCYCGLKTSRWDLCQNRAD